MESNGPACMYKIPPLYDFSHDVTLPTCMYKVDSLQSIVSSESHQPSSQSEEKALFEKIKQKQLQLSSRLDRLHKEVIAFNDSLDVKSDDVRTESPPVLSSPKPRDVVINADPRHPPYSLWVLCNLLAKSLRVQLATYLHSSLQSLPENIEKLNSPKDDVSPFDMNFTLIWKKLDGKNPEMMVDPIGHSVVEGEVNIARYLSRLLSPDYDDPFLGGQIDRWLETAHASFFHGTEKDQNVALKTMNAELGKRNYLVGDRLSAADVVLWSFVQQSNLSLPGNVSKWWNNLNASLEFRLPVKAC